MEKPLNNTVIDELLTRCLASRGYILVLESDMPPRFQRRGENELLAIPYETLHLAVLQRLIYDILPDSQIRKLEKNGNVSLLYHSENVATHNPECVKIFSVFVTLEKSHIAATFRLSPSR